ncbi:MAG: hypothetical protein ABR571_18580 [Jatrophihabitans sp.]|uniref:hypothetical protein n=1 Tax=Jatrophihabitans sp. TaxID=1932789 RepID=UPI0039142BDB
MPDLEDRLRDLLHERADAVHPALTGATVRSAAERRHTRLMLPLAAAAIVAVLAVSLTFVLNRGGHSHRIQPGGATTAPALSSAPIGPSPSPSLTSTSPTPTAPRRLVTSPTVAPSAVVGPIGGLPQTSNAPGSTTGTPASATPPR